MPPTVRIANIRRVARHSRAGTLYAPCVVRDGDRELLYTQGGFVTDSMFQEDAATPREFLSKFDRSGDPICVWERPVGGIDFAFIGVAVHAHSPDVFLWMTDETFLRAHPESYIGSTGGPCVYKDARGLWHMWFAATVAAIGADPARLGDAAYMRDHTPTEARDSRQFTIRHAVSDDGIHWRRRSHNRKHDNVALQDTVAYFGRFEVREHWGEGAECGASSVWAVPVTDVATGLIIQCFFGKENPTGDNQKNGLLFYDDSTETWLQWSVPADGGMHGFDGELGDWYTQSIWTVGNPYAHIIDSVIPMPPAVRAVRVKDGLPIGRFIATSVPDGLPEIAVSDDTQTPLSSWSKPEPIGLPFPIAGITNFRFREDGAIARFSSNDAYLTHGGKHGATGSGLFESSDIYETDVIWGDPPVKKIAKRRAAATSITA